MPTDSPRISAPLASEASDSREARIARASGDRQAGGSRAQSARGGGAPQGRTTFAPRHRPVVRALAEALFSPDGELDDAALDALVAETDRFVSPASKTLRFGLKLMLFAINVSPFFYGKLHTFANLPNDARIHHLERLESSSIAQLPLLVVSYKTMMTMLFYDDPERLRAIGYSGERARWRRSLPVAEPSAVREPRA